ncbi:hypothetical protein [Leucobacter luti]|uniref:Uncharacterized protein n=1 Tax=Leucobacter luti TaxID=340320 RepID=A0A4Q7TUL3_9MICO|nr:hypothetical protein [Leucobacter luti]MBL3698279.1 hypothetical protein [Leucobacter luti]RZT64636.1 hypothetical protein EV139_2057 [Leucobacter luti]
MSRTIRGAGGAGRTLRRVAIASLAVALGAGAAGCAPRGDAGPGAAGSSSAVVVESAPVGEVSGLDGELRVGEELRVLIDTPDVDWRVTSADSTVAQVVEDDPDANPRVVSVRAAGAGTAVVEFMPAGRDADAQALEVTVAGGDE